MLLPSISSEFQKLDSLISDLDKAASTTELAVQHVYTASLVLASAALIENSVSSILSAYGRRNGNARIAKYIEKSIGRLNSLNCEKISKLLDQFDRSWWQSVVLVTQSSDREAIDSLKTLRDQVAHGRQNGTGYAVVKNYYSASKRFVTALNDVIIEG